MSNPFEFLCYGDYADLYCEETDSLQLRWEEGKLERAVSGRDRGMGLQIQAGEELRYGVIDSLDFQQVVPLMPTLSLGLSRQRVIQPKPVQLGRQLVVPAPDSVSLDLKVKLLEHLDQRIKTLCGSEGRQVSLSLGQSRKRIKILTSEGDTTDETRAYLTLAVQVVVKRGEVVQTAYEALAGLGGWDYLKQHDPLALAERVAKRGLAKLSASHAPAGEMPVIIAAQAGGTLIHEAIGHSLEADAVQKGVSPAYRGRIGQQVANDKITVMEDPTRLGQRGSYEFDDEGIRATPVTLIKKGVLKTYLYDRKTARKDGVSSNAHGRRESFRCRPIPRMANTFLAAGLDDPEEILGSLEQGFLVTRMGGGQVDPATNDFVFEVEEGFRIEGGKSTRMVRGATLLGNGPEVLKSIDRVGTDLGWSVGTCGKDGQGVPVSDGLPTLRIPKVVVGGQALHTTGGQA